MANIIRVVGIRRGKVNPAEFRLRPSEKGLSLFLNEPEFPVTRILEAVRACGKRGDLAAAVLAMEHFQALGLKLIPTPGGTPFPEINALHHETRFRWWRKLWLLFQRRSAYDYFNEIVAPQLSALATILEG